MTFTRKFTRKNLNCCNSKSTSNDQHVCQEGQTNEAKGRVLYQLSSAPLSLLTPRSYTHSYETESSSCVLCLKAFIDTLPFDIRKQNCHHRGWQWSKCPCLKGLSAHELCARGHAKSTTPLPKENRQCVQFASLTTKECFLALQVIACWFNFFNASLIL